MQFIDLKTQSARVKANIMQRFSDIIDNSAYIMGAEIQELESKLSEFVKVKHAISVSSGTDALLIALMALEIKPGDEVITTPFSFFATAEVIALLGAKPVYVDIEPDTYNINADLIENAITEKTKAVMPVSLYGQCPDIDRINEIAKKYNLPVIEDAAQSFGAKYNGKDSCGVTTIGCTSFFPSKPLGCFGDGGACFTNDDELAAKMKEIRLHGQSARYTHTSLGINGRLDTMQAAVLLEKMTIFPEEITKRQQIADHYNTLLSDVVKTPVIKPGRTSVYAQYTIEVDDRQRFQAELKVKGIPTATHYPIGLHQQPVFRKIYGQDLSYPVTELAGSRVVSLPMHPYLSESQQAEVCSVVIDVVSEPVC